MNEYKDSIHKMTSLIEEETSDVFDETHYTTPKTADDSVFDDFSQLNVDENVDKKYQALNETIDELTSENEELVEKVLHLEDELKCESKSKQCEYSEFRRTCRKIRRSIRHGDYGGAVSIAEEWCCDVPSDYTSDEDG